MAVLNLSFFISEWPQIEDSIMSRNHGNLKEGWVTHVAKNIEANPRIVGGPFEIKPFNCDEPIPDLVLVETPIKKHFVPFVNFNTCNKALTDPSGDTYCIKDTEKVKIVVGDTLNLRPIQQANANKYLETNTLHF